MLLLILVEECGLYSSDHTVCLPGVDILQFPVSPSFDFAPFPSCNPVVVRSGVAFAFLDESLVDKRVQIRIETAMLDIFIVVVFKGSVESLDSVGIGR